MPGLRRVPFFRFSLMWIRADSDGTLDRVSARWSALNGQTLISLTANYPHQQLIDKQLAKGKILCRRGLTVNLLDTQIGLVEADQGVAVIPSFGLPACRNRKVTMSELIEPLIALEFYEISSRARKLPAEATIERTTVNAWHDMRIVDAVKATGRKNLIVTGISTDVCLAFPAMAALADGFQSHAVIDASGGFSQTQVDMGILRMQQAGVVPVGYSNVAIEILADNAAPEAEAVYGALGMPFSGLVSDLRQYFSRR